MANPMERPDPDPGFVDSTSTGPPDGKFGQFKFDFEVIDSTLDEALLEALEALRAESSNMTTVWLIVALLSAAFVWGHLDFTPWVRYPLGLAVVLLALGRALPHANAYLDSEAALHALRKNTTQDHE